MVRCTDEAGHSEAIVRKSDELARDLLVPPGNGVYCAVLLHIAGKNDY